MTDSTYSWMLMYMFQSCTLWDGIWWFARRFSFIICLACPLECSHCFCHAYIHCISPLANYPLQILVHRSDWIVLMHQFTNLDFGKISGFHRIPHVMNFCELSCQHGCLARLLCAFKGGGRMEGNQQKIQRKIGYVCIKSIKYKYCILSYIHVPRYVSLYLFILQIQNYRSCFGSVFEVLAKLLTL